VFCAKPTEGGMVRGSKRPGPVCNPGTPAQVSRRVWRLPGPTQPLRIARRCDLYPDETVLVDLHDTSVVDQALNRALADPLTEPVIFEMYSAVNGDETADHWRRSGRQRAWFKLRLQEHFRVGDLVVLQGVEPWLSSGAAGSQTQSKAETAGEDAPPAASL